MATVMAPLAGGCYFAVDLLAEGTFTVERTEAGKTERRTLRVAAYPIPSSTSRSRINPRSTCLQRI